jgi:hypothetical protein
LPVKRIESGQNNGNWYIAGCQTYIFNANGDIAGTTEYDTSGIQLSVRNFTYSNEENIFQPFCLIGYGAHMGFFNLLEPDYFFNKHVISGYTEFSNGTPCYSVQHTFTRGSTGKRITGAVTGPGAYPSPGTLDHVFTRNFFYDCK